MEQFMREIEAYAAARGLEPSTIVQRSAKVSGATWAKWRSGKSSPTMIVADRVRAYMAANPPQDNATQSAA